MPPGQSDSGAIIMWPDGVTLHGESVDDIDRAVDHGVLYNCKHDQADAGQPCPAGQWHSSLGFYHLVAGKTPADYEDFVDG